MRRRFERILTSLTSYKRNVSGRCHVKYTVAGSHSSNGQGLECGSARWKYFKLPRGCRSASIAVPASLPQGERSPITHLRPNCNHIDDRDRQNMEHTPRPVSGYCGMTVPWEKRTRTPGVHAIDGQGKNCRERRPHNRHNLFQYRKITSIVTSHRSHSLPGDGRLRTLRNCGINLSRGIHERRDLCVCDLGSPLQKTR